MKTTKRLGRGVVRAGELAAGDWIFESDGYGFKVLRVVDKGKNVDLYLESDGLLHISVATMKKNKKLYAKTQEGVL